jgi:hypothetical protein
MQRQAEGRKTTREARLLLRHGERLRAERQRARGRDLAQVYRPKLLQTLERASLLIDSDFRWLRLILRRAHAADAGYLISFALILKEL